MNLMSELSPQSLIEKYISEARIMQLATLRGEYPWICNLHFVADENSSIYWISRPDRRHSEEIAANPNVAITVAVQTDKPLIGIQAEGTAEIVEDTKKIKTAMETYIERHGTDRAFADKIIDGTSDHKLYKFIPKRFSLFDQVNFLGMPPQVWSVDNK